MAFQFMTEETDGQRVCLGFKTDSDDRFRPILKFKRHPPPGFYTIGTFNPTKRRGDTSQDLIALEGFWGGGGGVHALALDQMTTTH